MNAARLAVVTVATAAVVASAHPCDSLYNFKNNGDPVNPSPRIRDISGGEGKAIHFHRPKGGDVTGWSLMEKHADWLPGSGPYAPMNAWNEEGASNLSQKSLTFSILNQPENPEYIAFFSNGLESCPGYHQTTTGSNDGWRESISSNLQWTDGISHISKKGAAHIFLDGNNQKWSYGEDLTVFDKSKTLIVSVMDASFTFPGFWVGTLGAAGSAFLHKCNLANSFGENNSMLKGWKRWLDHRVNWYNIKGFYGYGMSRGGCFVTRLADYVFNAEPQLQSQSKLILETIDPVCHPGEWPEDVQVKIPKSEQSQFLDEELWNGHLLATNPFVKQGSVSSGGTYDYQCFAINAKNLFGQNMPRQNIRWLNAVSGENVLAQNGVAGTIHSFCDVATVHNKYTLPGPYGWGLSHHKYQNLYLTPSDTWGDGHTHTTDPLVWQHSQEYQAPAAGSWGDNTGIGGYGAMNSNNPLAVCCDCWYQQTWTPFSHMEMGGGYYHGNLNNPTCYGESKCGWGNKPTCQPNPRADLDWIYKAFKHASIAADSWAETRPSTGRQPVCNLDPKPDCAPEYIWVADPNGSVGTYTMGPDGAPAFVGCPEPYTVADGQGNCGRNFANPKCLSFELAPAGSAVRDDGKYGDDATLPIPLFKPKQDNEHDVAYWLKFNENPVIESEEFFEDGIEAHSGAKADSEAKAIRG